MARSDLILSLVKASASGDSAKLQACVEALAAEEKAKNHSIFASRILQAYSENKGRARAHFNSSSRHLNEYLIEKEPRRNLDDIVLPDLAKQALCELIEEQHRASILRAHSLEPRNKILLVGPPGNGKTSVAEALAEALMVPLFVVRYEAVIGSFLGETASRLKRVFDFAKTTPCVLFFDEFDALGKERGDEHETGEIKRVVTSLLLQFDAIPSYTVLVAATNHHELLDRAAWRRFQLRINLPRPSRSQLGSFIKNRLSHVDEPLGRQPDSIARRLGTISFSEAEEFCLDVMRRRVLSAAGNTLKNTIDQQLKVWANRAGQPANREGVVTNGVPISKDCRSDKS
jgi:SpoVK/Ycf46/Vps4 family AAA+-type ATPase